MSTEPGPVFPLFARNLGRRRAQRLSSKRLRAALEEDFEGCCAYCLFHDPLMEAFEVEHFRPRKLFPALARDYANLRYACRICNLAKGETWPSPEQEREGVVFVDFTREPWSRHFELIGAGILSPLSRPGAFTLDKLALNRQSLVRRRRFLADETRRRACAPIDWDRPLSSQLFQLFPSLGRD